MVDSTMPNRERFFYWLSEVKRIAPGTILNYRLHLRLLHEAGGDILKFTEYRQIESLILDVKVSRRWGDTTTFKSAVISKHYYDWAFRERLIDSNPMASGHAFKKNENTRVDFFDWDSESFNKLLKNPNNSVRINAMLHILRSSGIRNGELCNLKQSDHKGRILSVCGKTGRREAIIDEEALMWLEAYKEGLKLLYSGEWLFTLEDYTKKITEHALWQQVQNLGRKIGIERCYPHMFRHSLAGQVLKKGGDIALAADLLGHKSLSMSKRYLHFSSDTRKKMYDQILKK